MAESLSTGVLPPPGQPVTGQPTDTAPDMEPAPVPVPVAAASPADSAPDTPSDPAVDADTLVAQTLLDAVKVAVRERFPHVQTTRIVDVRSQLWGRKHVVITVSSSRNAASIVGVHVFDGDFEKLLRTLDVFAEREDLWPTVQRVAADSVVVRLTPEKGPTPPNSRRAYEWRSIEE